MVSLRKNRLDLEHSAIMQERGVYLGLVVGYPFTILNIIVALGWHLEPWFPLVLVLIAVSWTPLYLLFNDRNKQVQQKQAEIEALINLLE
jgi:hypothetical protein